MSETQHLVGNGYRPERVELQVPEIEESTSSSSTSFPADPEIEDYPQHGLEEATNSGSHSGRKGAQESSVIEHEEEKVEVKEKESLLRDKGTMNKVVSRQDEMLADDELSEGLSIAFGSCVQQQFDSLTMVRKMWDHNPDVLAIIGDIVYLDMAPKSWSCCDALFNCLWDDVSIPPERAYSTLGKHPDFHPNFVDKSNLEPGYDPMILLAWDDHDFAYDNAKGRKVSLTTKNTSRSSFLQFFHKVNPDKELPAELAAVEQEDEESGRPGTWYHWDTTKRVKNEETGEPVDMMVRFISLDVRYHRTKSDILGEFQWKWLENLLDETYKKNPHWVVIMTGTPWYIEHPLTTKHLGGESWTRGSRTRFEALVKESGLRSKTVLLSGDVHYGCIHRDPADKKMPEFISSSLTHTIGCCEMCMGVKCFEKGGKDKRKLEKYHRIGCCCAKFRCTTYTEVGERYPGDGCCAGCWPWGGVITQNNYGYLTLTPTKWKFRFETPSGPVLPLEGTHTMK